MATLTIRNKVCVSLGKTLTNTRKMLETTTGKPKMCLSLVYKWHTRFLKGRSSTKADPRSGRPRILNAGLVKRSFKRAGAFSRVGVSHSTILHILTDAFRMSKVAARWIPRLRPAKIRRAGLLHQGPF